MGLISLLTKALIFGITIVALIIVALDGVLAILQATNLTLMGIYEYLIPPSTFYITLMLLLKILTQKEKLVHIIFYISSIHISLIILFSNLEIGTLTFTFLAISLLIVKNKKKQKIILSDIPNLIAIHQGVAVLEDDEGLLKAICAIEIFNPENLDKNSIIGFLNALKLLNTNISLEFHKFRKKIRFFILTWCKGKDFEKVVKRVEEHAKNISNYLNFFKFENQILIDEISIEECIFAPILNWSIKKPNITIDENYTTASLHGNPLLKTNLNNIPENFHLSIILSPVNYENDLPPIPPYTFTLIENKEFLAMLSEKWETTIYLVASKESIRSIAAFFGLKPSETNLRNLILREHVEKSLKYSLIDILKLFPCFGEELKIAARNS